MHRLDGSFLSRLMKTGVVGLLWLLGAASATYASPAPGPERVVCDVQTQARTLRNLLKHPKSYGGPLATRSSNTALGLRFDLTHHLRRVKRTTASNDGAVIQNDAPAARVDADDQSLPSLQSLGFLVGPFDSRPITLACSPRSPRGPPAAI